MACNIPIVSKQFANGFSVYVSPCRGIAAQVEICVRTGSIHENELLGCGISHYLEHMLFQGCKNYPARSVSETVSMLGGNMNAYTTFDRTDYHIILPAKHVMKAVDILFSMVRFPEFPEETCRSEKEVISRECDLSLDKPGVVTIQKLISEVYRVHPVRIPVIGYKDKISAVTREDLVSYHAKRYTPERCFLVVTGNVNSEEIFAAVEEWVSNWKNSGSCDPILPQEPEQLWKRENEFTFPDNLSRLVIGTRPSAALEDIAAHNILWGALGMGYAGILPVKFTVNNPLALDLRIIDYTLPGGGLCGVSAIAKESDISKLKSGILKELEHIAKNGIPRAAIVQEKTQQYAEKLRRANDIENIAAEIVDNIIQNGSPDKENSMFKKINAVTVEQVMETAKKELVQDKFSIVTQHCNESGKKSIYIRQQTTGYTVSSTPEGCEVLSIQDKTVPQISMALVMPGGPLFDPAEKTGLSSMAIRMLSTGTEKHSEEQILTRLDRCGADFYAQCHANSAICQLTVPKKHFSKAFALFAEQLVSGKFAEEIFSREIERVADGLRHRAITPSSAAIKRALELLMNNHPSAIGKDGSLDTIQLLKAKDAKDFFSRMLCSGMLKIGFAGDISCQDAEKYAFNLTASCIKSISPLPMTTPPVFTKQEIFEQIPLKKEQTAVIMSFAGIKAVSRKEQLAQAILRQLENGLSSAIFEKVREDNSLAYSVGLNTMSGLQQGAISFHATTAKGKTGLVLQLFREELERLKQHKISAEEFARAREQAAFASCINLNNPAYMLPESLLDLYYRNPVKTNPQELENEYLNFTQKDFYDVFDEPFQNAVPVCVEAGNI